MVLIILLLALSGLVPLFGHIFRVTMPAMLHLIMLNVIGLKPPYSTKKNEEKGKQDFLAALTESRIINRIKETSISHDHMMGTFSNIW